MASASSPSSASTKEFHLGEWLVQPNLNALSNHGNTVHLRPKAMDVLVVLAHHAGEVVSRRVILDAAWEGEPVADSALAGVICELREAFGDDPKAPSFIATIPRRGYRLIAPVSPVEDRPAEGDSGRGEPAIHWRTGLLLVLTTVAISAATAMLVRHLMRPEPAAPPETPPRIAVLPFENLGEPVDEYLAAGITEEITARLTAIKGLVVIARESASMFAGSAKSASQIGAELGVDYLLMGTVRWQPSVTGASQVRITPRLVGVADGANLWVETYDHDLEDIFAVQGEIGHQVANHLGVALVNGEESSLASSPTANTAAYQAYLLGRHHIDASESREDVAMAVAMFERAIELDPGFTVAYTALAQAHATTYFVGLDRSEERAAAAREAASRAAVLDPGNPEVRLASAAILLYVDRDFPAALREIRAALDHRPGSTDALAMEADCLAGMGRFEEALARMETAVSLSPMDQMLLNETAGYRISLRRYAEADRDYARAAELAPDRFRAFVGRARAALLQDGSTARARAILAEAPPGDRPRLAVEHLLLDLCDRDWDSALARLAAIPRETVYVSLGLYHTDQLRGEILLLKDEQAGAREAFAAAIEDLETSWAVQDEAYFPHSALGLAYAGLGRAAEAEREGERGVELCPMESDAIAGGIPLATLAQIYVMTGELDAAAATLDRLLSSPGNPFALPLLQLDPRWDPLSSHPRFPELLAKLAPIE